MLQFLANKGIDEDHRGEIVDELFNKCDQDRSGRIELNEFVGHYIDTKNQLVMQDEDHSHTIMMHHAQITQLQQQKEQAKLNYTRVYGKASTTLKVLVQKAEKLPAAGQYQVHLS